MSGFQPATLLRVHICERDRYQGKPLLECILQKCREFHVAKATAVRGLEGFGAASEIHRARPLVHNLPVVITIIDTPEKIDRLIPEMEQMMDAGVIATSRVEAIVVNRQAQVQHAS
ncbi:MAG: DUF190 domain-containing protein [Bryobacteraceae bacterium]|jgi:PII-like signaling protein